MFRKYITGRCPRCKTIINIPIKDKYVQCGICAYHDEVKYFIG